MSRRAGTLLAAAGLALAACANPLERPPLEKTRFVLDLPDAPAPARRDAGVLSVGRPRVSPLFDRKNFVYRTGADTFESDPFHEWLAAPGEVIRQTLIDRLDAASPFRDVQRGSVTGAEWLLEMEVDRLYADRRERAAAAVLAGRFRLVDLRATRPRRALELRFDEREPAASGDAQALVDAWARALGRALDVLDARLDAVVAAPTRTGAR